MEPQVGAAASAIAVADFSFWTLFTRADFIVKSVIIILILASIYSWALIFEKYIAGQEIQVAVMNNKAMGAIELKPVRDFYDYKAKYSARAKT